MRISFRELLVALLVAGLFCTVIASMAKAQDNIACPPDKTCKTIVITAEQENVLDQLITQTCIQGPYAQIAELVKFYKDLLAKAPAGKPVAASGTAPTPPAQPIITPPSK